MSVYLELSSFDQDDEKPSADEEVGQDPIEKKRSGIKFQDEDDYDQAQVYNDSDEEPDVEDLVNIKKKLYFQLCKLYFKVGILFLNKPFLIAFN